MRGLFLDRRDAGRQLAARLRRLLERRDVVVLALPPGGVAVAQELARALHAPLDVCVVRELGLPGYETLAVGAIANGGVLVVDPGVVESLGVRDEMVNAVARVERHELTRQEREYRHGRPAPRLRDHTVVLVEDGIATGVPMLAAVEAVRAHHPREVIVAAPVISHAARTLLERAADCCECVLSPEPFYGVGLWYEDFEPPTEDEVRAMLAEASAPAAHRAGIAAHPEYENAGANALAAGDAPWEEP